MGATSEGLERSVLVIGSAALDAKARVREPLTRGSSVPGQIRISVGGVARNVAECLARFEVPTQLLTVVGDDTLGAYILDVTARAGVDVSPTLCVPGARSGAFFAMIEPEGGRAWSIDDMAGLAYLTPERILQARSLIQQARTVFLDSNIPTDTLETIIQICQENGVSLCADPTSPYLAPRLLPFVSSLNLITPNQAEAAILCDCEINDLDDALKAAKQLVRMGVKMALITMGDMGVVYATANESGHVEAPDVDVVDLTGASDAVTATVVFALIHDFPVDEAVRLAVTAAALTITTQDTVRSDLSLELLYDSMLV